MTEDESIRFTIRMGLSKCSKSLFLALAKKLPADAEYEIAADNILKQIRLAGYEVVHVKPPARPLNTHPS